MQKIRNRFLTIVIAMFLIISMSASIILIPNANAHTPAWNMPTFAYIQAMPNPVGVGQQVYIYIWLTTTFEGTNKINDYRFHNYKLTITAPDGTVSTQTWAYIADTTSSQGYAYTPSQVGTYLLNFTFPGQNINDYSHANDAYVNDTYLPSSASTTLTVQEEGLPGEITGFPLPTDYWTRPIYGENSNWYSISSDWLGTGAPPLTYNLGTSKYVPDAVGPQTSHIMWTKPLQNGGVVGGNPFTDAQGVGYFEGSAYNARYTNPIILDGCLYYTEPVDFTGSSGGKTYCVDLRSGQIIWSTPQIPALSFGYIYNLWNGNQHGTYPPILFTANFARAFDAFTGDPLFNVTGVPTGTVAAGPNGEQLRYVLTNSGNATNPKWYLSEWNSSRLWATFSNPFTGAGVNSPTLYNYSYTNGTTLSNFDAQQAAVTQPTITIPAGKDLTQPATYNYVVYGNVVNSSSSIYSYDWNVSVPWLNTLTSTTGVISGYYNDMLLCYNASQTATLAGGSIPSFGGTGLLPTPSVPYTYFAINLNPSKGNIGSILWSNTLQPPANNITAVYAGTDPTGRVFLEEYKQTMQYVAYDLDTGAKLWGPSEPQTALDYYGNQFSGGMMGQLAYGKLYSVGFAGILYTRDERTGDLLWTYGNGGAGNSTNAGFATNYGDYPTFVTAIGNGIIYTETTEHTILDPIYKGSLVRAINATDGTELWTLSDYTGGGGTSTSYAIADGYATFFNGYDNQIYVLGRGSSATTVEAPLTDVPLGSGLVIQGTVVDTSAGTTQNQQAKVFPNGVPVASDVCMKEWMAYVYQQKPLPTNFVGVPVSIDVVDANGNFRNIGSTTTSSDGTYSFHWKPDIEGKYTVYASFVGSNGYWPSHASAAFGVGQAAATTSPYPIVNLPPTEMYIAAAAVAIIIAIAIGFAITIMVLKKRP